MIFLDASAFIAVLAKEADSADLLTKIENDTQRLFSAVSRWETIVALCRLRGLSPAEAALIVDDFLDTFAFAIVAIARKEADLAGNAYERYGRGRHPAALNMGDCFAYACAKSRGATLLYKGDDFAKTDLG